MKKVFKMMAIALTACGLFVACGDKNEEEEQVKDGIAVAFGEDTSWDAQDILGDQSYVAQYNVMQLGAFKDYDDAEAPYTQGYLAPAVGTYTHVAQQDYYYMFYFENENDYTVYNGNNYPKWQARTFNEDITAIDLTAMTISGNCNGTLYNLTDYMNEVTTEKDLVVTMTNAAWEDVSKARGFKPMAEFVK